MSTPRPKLSTASENLFFSGLVLAIASPIVGIIGVAFVGAGHGSPALFIAGVAGSAVAELLFLASLITSIIRQRRGDSSSLMLIPPILGTCSYPLVFRPVLRSMTLPQPSAIAANSDTRLTYDCQSTESGIWNQSSALASLQLLHPPLRGNFTRLRV